MMTIVCASNNKQQTTIWGKRRCFLPLAGVPLLLLVFGSVSLMFLRRKCCTPEMSEGDRVKTATLFVLAENGCDNKLSCHKANLSILQQSSSSENNNNTTTNVSSIASYLFSVVAHFVISCLLALCVYVFYLHCFCCRCHIVVVVVLSLSLSISALFASYLLLIPLSLSLCCCCLFCDCIEVTLSLSSSHCRCFRQSAAAAAASAAEPSAAAGAAGM